MRPQWKRIALITPGIVILLIFLVFGVQGVWSVGLIGNAEELVRYQFGNPEVIAHGGDKFRSAGSYAAFCTVVTVTAASGIYLGFRRAVSESNPSLSGAYLRMAASFVLLIILIGAW